MEKNRNYLIWHTKKELVKKQGTKKDVLSFGSITEMPVSVKINNICYINVFTCITSVSEKTGRSSVRYLCNITGVKFGDSHKKCIEHTKNHFKHEKL